MEKPQVKMHKYTLEQIFTESEDQRVWSFMLGGSIVFTDYDHSSDPNTLELVEGIARSLLPNDLIALVGMLEEE